MVPEIRRIEHGKWTELVLDRPERRNAMSVAMWEALDDLLEELLAKPPLALLLRGGSWETFTTGSDVKEFAEVGFERVDHSLRVMESAICRLDALPCPIVAAVDGYALGGGFELCMAADLRIGTARVRLGMPIARFGIMVTAPIAKRLVQLLGPGRSLDLLYTGRLLSGDEARAWGALNYVVAASELPSAAEELMERIVAQSPSSLLAAKRAVALCLPVLREPGDQNLPPYFVDPDDLAEGIAAFKEGRPPRFQ